MPPPRREPFKFPIAKSAVITVGLLVLAVVISAVIR